MKKLTFIAVALAIATAVSAADRFTGTITVPAGDTNATSTVNLFKADNQFYTVASEVDTVFATVVSGTGTGVVTFAVAEFDKADAAFSTSDSMVAEDAFFDRPVASETIANVTYVPLSVSTNEIDWTIVYRPYTNSVVVPRAITARQVKVTATQLAVAADTVYRWTILVKNDPPGSKK